MPRPPLLLAALALGAISAAALVACGSSNDGTIPAANADSMLAALSAASAADSSGDCGAIQENASAVADEAAGLPTTVDPKVKSAIIGGAEQLFKLAGPDGVCESSSSGGGGKKTTKTTSTTSTSSTSSTPTTTTTTPTTTTPTQPPSEGGNLGGGNSGGTPPKNGSGGTSG